MRVLAVGDVCADLGTKALVKELPRLKRELGADIVIVNGENSDERNGISSASASDIFAAGADVITGGNHTLRHREIHPILDDNPFLLRPHNMLADYGSGYCLLDTGRVCVAVINLIGRVYLDSVEASNPFDAADELIDRAHSDGAKLIFVDFHAEATSEKKTLGFYLDGRVTALFGTHTHIQTADAHILSNKTGYITDLGMTGVENSVLGIKKEIIINRLKNGESSKFEFAEGDCILCGCLFEADEKSGKCTDVRKVFRKITLKR